MTIQHIIDEQMKEFNKSIFHGPDFLNNFARNLIEAVGEEIIGKDQREAELGYAVVILGKEENKLRAKQRAKLKEIINSLK